MKINESDSACSTSYVGLSASEMGMGSGVGGGEKGHCGRGQEVTAAPCETKLEALQLKV